MSFCFLKIRHDSSFKFFLTKKGSRPTHALQCGHRGLCNRQMPPVFGICKNLRGFFVFIQTIPEHPKYLREVGRGFTNGFFV